MWVCMGRSMISIDEKIRVALIKMHVYEREHNRVSYMHTKEILQLIYENTPVDEKDLKSMLRVSLGIDKRYVSQYLDGFRVWGVIFRENGMIYSEKPIPEQKAEVEVIAEIDTVKCKYLRAKATICGKTREAITEELCENCEKK